MPSKRKKTRILNEKRLRTFNTMVVVQQMTIPVKETEELKRINKLLENAKFID